MSEIDATYQQQLPKHSQPTPKQLNTDMNIVMDENYSDKIKESGCLIDQNNKKPAVADDHPGVDDGE